MQPLNLDRNLTKQQNHCFRTQFSGKSWILSKSLKKHQVTVQNLRYATQDIHFTPLKPLPARSCAGTTISTGITKITNLFGIPAKYQLSHSPNMLRNTANSPPKSTPGGFHENFQDFCRFTRDPGSSLQNPLYFACQTSTRLHSRISSKFTVFRKLPNSPIPSNVFKHGFYKKPQDFTEILQNPLFGFPYAAPEFGPKFSEITKLSFPPKFLEIFRNPFKNS